VSNSNQQQSTSEEDEMAQSNDDWTIWNLSGFWVSIAAAAAINTNQSACQQMNQLS
jgi:hypothetical protein